MEAIEKVQNAIGELTYAQLREVAQAVRDRLQDSLKENDWQPIAEALDDFYRNHANETT